jgi:formate/nitrite transporter FocA (FNT family)
MRLAIFVCLALVLCFVATAGAPKWVIILLFLALGLFGETIYERPSLGTGTRTPALIIIVILGCIVGGAYLITALHLMK